MEGDVHTPVSKAGNASGRVVRRRVSRVSINDKENFNVFGGHVGENQKKSPLPIGFPRRPLHDITAVLQSLDDEQEGECSRPRKYFTRSQGGACTTKYELTESRRNVVKRAGPSNEKKNNALVKLQATSTTVKFTDTLQLSVNLQIHEQENKENQENQEQNISNACQAKFKKTVTFAETESSEESSFPYFADNILDRPTPQTSYLNLEFSSSRKSETKEVTEKVKVEEGSFVLETKIEESGYHLDDDQRSMLKPDSSASSARNEVKGSSSSAAYTGDMDGAVEAKKTRVPLQIRNQQAHDQKKQKPLSSRSSVVKFR